MSCVNCLIPSDETPVVDSGCAKNSYVNKSSSTYKASRFVANAVFLFIYVA